MYQKTKERVLLTLGTISYFLIVFSILRATYIFFGFWWLVFVVGAVLFFTAPLLMLVFETFD